MLDSHGLLLGRTKKGDSKPPVYISPNSSSIVINKLQTTFPSNNTYLHIKDIEKHDKP